MIKQLQGEPLDTVAPTIGFSCGDIKYKKDRVKLFDLGGGAKIRPIWRNYYAELHGVIFVLDAGDKNRVQENAEVLQGVLNHPKMAGKPILILANKQDLANAIDAKEILKNLDVKALADKHDSAYKVKGCSALSRKSVRRAMGWLAGIIASDWDQQNARVVIDTQEQRERETADRRQRTERVRRQREERERLEKADGKSKQEDAQDIVGDPFKPLDLEELKKKEAALKAENEKKKAEEKKQGDAKENVVAEQKLDNMNTVQVFQVDQDDGDDDDDDNDVIFKPSPWSPGAKKSQDAPSAKLVESTALLGLVEVDTTRLSGQIELETTTSLPGQVEMATSQPGLVQVQSTGIPGLAEVETTMVRMSGSVKTFEDKKAPPSKLVGTTSLPSASLEVDSSVNYAENKVPNHFKQGPVSRKQILKPLGETVTKKKKKQKKRKNRVAPAETKELPPTRRQLDNANQEHGVPDSDLDDSNLGTYY